MNDDPAAFLKLPPSDEGKLLTEQADQHAGAATPFWMFAEVAVRQRKTSAWIAERSEVERKIRRRAAAGLAALAANLVLLFGYAAHRLEAGGAAEQRAIEQDRSIQELKTDIRELRAELRRYVGADAPKIDGADDTGSEPDGKFTNLDRWGSVLASVLPGRLPSPQSSCGRICSSSIECTSLVPSCKYCNFGECKATRPESPTPVDAGVDAPGGTQP